MFSAKKRLSFICLWKAAIKITELKRNCVNANYERKFVNTAEEPRTGTTEEYITICLNARIHDSVSVCQTLKLKSLDIAGRKIKITMVVALSKNSLL